MRKTTMPALLGLACLMAMPPVAHARYLDGMNLYEYVQSAPATATDPTGEWKQSADNPNHWCAVSPTDTLQSLAQEQYNSEASAS